MDKSNGAPGEQPARYKLPAPLSDDTLLGRNIAYAVEKRKTISQLREGLLATKKQIGKENREDARYLSELCSDFMKQYRGWDFCIKWIEGNPDCVNWRTPTMQEEIAPYADKAFYELDMA